MRLEYLPPKDIIGAKEKIKESLLAQGASPVIKSGLALKIAREFSRKDDKILDCGPGAGSFLESLHNMAFENLYAVDIDDYLIFKNSVEFKKIDLSFDKISWPDEYFDVATAWQLVEHLENPNNFIREISRVLKPNGLFIISTPNIQHIFNRIFFLRKGDMYRWHKKNNHISLFPKGIFQKTFLKYFNIVDTRYTEGEFPYRFLSRFKLPANKMFGRDVIYIFGKK